jgi:hypothetical protein
VGRGFSRVPNPQPLEGAVLTLPLQPRSNHIKKQRLSS